MTETERKLKDLETAPLHKGRNSLIKHLKGERITQIPMIESKCYDCMGFYDDGARDCECPNCPLYPFMPYGRIRQKSPVEAL